MIPDLKRRLSEAGGSDGALQLGTLVCANFLPLGSKVIVPFRSRRVLHVLEQTTLEALRGPFWIGSSPTVKS